MPVEVTLHLDGRPGGTYANDAGKQEVRGTSDSSESKYLSPSTASGDPMGATEFDGSNRCLPPPSPAADGRRRIRTAALRIRTPVSTSSWTVRPEPTGRVERPQSPYKGGALPVELCRHSLHQESNLELVPTTDAFCRLNYAGTDRAWDSNPHLGHHTVEGCQFPQPGHAKTPITRWAMERPGVEPGQPTFQAGALPIELSLHSTSK